MNTTITMKIPKGWTQVFKDLDTSKIKGLIGMTTTKGNKIKTNENTIQEGKTLGHSIIY